MAGPPGTTTSIALGGTTLDGGCSNATSEPRSQHAQDPRQPGEAEALPLRFS